MWSNPIQPNASVTIGLVGNKIPDTEVTVTNLALSQVVIEPLVPELPEEPALYLGAFAEYAADSNTILIKWYSTIPEGKFDILTSEDNLTFTALAGVENTDHFNMLADFSKKYIKVSQTTPAQSTETSVFVVEKTENGYSVRFLDSDGDRLIDIVENISGTDILLPDTDADGLTDYEESVILDTDPLVFDSVTPGLSDAEADKDSDGLSNRYELDNGTNPLYGDTDNDTLTDGEEVNGFMTDPLKEDTDTDGASDGWEIAEGHDPLVFNESFAVSQSLAGESISAQVDVALKAEQAETLSVSLVEDSPFLNADTPGYIGSAFDFSVSGEINEAILSFTFDAALLEDETFEPAIFYWNEETQLLEELETTVTGNTATAKTTHFSQYVLLNKRTKTDFEDSYDGKVVFHSTDVVFVIDYSGSMDWNDPDGLRLDVTNGFIDNLPDQDMAGIVKFIAVSSTLSGLTNDKAALKALVSGITNDDMTRQGISGTNGSAGVNDAIKVLETSTADKKCIVFLTDGEDTLVSYAYDDLVATASEKNIKIYSVGLGSANATLLSEVAEGTGGKYYYASSSQDFDEIYGAIENEIIDRQLDSNKDGISDFETRLLCENTISYATGAKNCFAGLSYDEINNDTDGDYDNDGLKNGQEMKVTISSDGMVYVKMTSYPTKADSDGDGLLDGAGCEVNGKIVAPLDNYPLKYDGPKGMWAEHVATVKEGGIPTELDGWLGFTQPAEALPNTGTEGFRTSKEEMQYLVDHGIVILTEDEKAYVNDFYSLLLAIEEGKSLEETVRVLLEEAMYGGVTERIERLKRLLEDILAGNFANLTSVKEVLDYLRGHVADGQDADQVLASLGSRLLNFKTDNQGVVHSQYNTWQEYGGYSNLYDAIFRGASRGNMDREKFDFTVGDKKYRLWAWRGDYLNIGAGNELGVYWLPAFIPDDPNGLDQYLTDKNLAVPMQLYLYNYYSSSNIENILSYQPSEKQWWITGFNPEHVGLADVNKQVMVACVDFSELPNGEDMYKNFKAEMIINKEKSKYLLWDNNNNRIVWIIWGE